MEVEKEGDFVEFLFMEYQIFEVEVMNFFEEVIFDNWFEGKDV